MPKSERLFQLVELLSHRDGATVEEIAKQVGVSIRTAYRYLATLNEAKMPVDYDGHYSLKHDNKVGPTPLSTIQLELLKYCLDNNPLTAYPFFRKESGQMRTVLQRLADNTASPAIKLVRVNPQSREQAAARPKKEWCLTFTDAIKRRRKIRLKLKRTRHRGNVVTPVVLCISPDGPGMAIESQDMPLTTIHADRIGDMEIVNDRFRLADLSLEARRLLR